METKIESILNQIIIAFEGGYSDSIIIIYKDTFNAIGPFLDVDSALEAVVNANNTRREFIVQTWNHKGKANNARI